MKIQIVKSLIALRRLSMGLAAFALFLAPAFSQPLDSWQTALDVPLPIGANSFGADVGTTPSGEVFLVSGVTVNNVSQPPNVMVSADAGATWNDISGLFQDSTTLNAFASDPGTGALYMGGSWASPTGNQWIVLGSFDGGVTWAVIDQVQLAAGNSAYCADIACDGLGNVYAVGSAMDSSGRPHWLVRRSSLAESQWVTVHDLSTTPSGVARCSAVACKPGLGVFVVGTLSKTITVSGKGKKTSTTSVPAWTVKRSDDGGATWQDSLYYAPTSKGASGFDLVIDSQNRIYTVGTTNYGGELLQSRDGGLSWVRAQAFGQNNEPWALVARQGEGPDDLYVTGYQVTQGEVYWLTWHITGTGTLTVSDRFPGRALAIANHPLGSVFATGSVRDASGNLHWVTRKLEIP